ncbi:Peptidase T [subsurface metagenome]
MEKLVERFIKYVKINTQSDEKSDQCPTNPSELELAKLLAKELKGIGLEEVEVDDNSYLMATLPANTNKAVPTIGFIAHLDTSPDSTAENINPIVFENYFGKNLVLNKKKNITLSPRDFPALNHYIGQPLITTDGTTLLGADNKAGIAEIITAMETLKNNPDIKHGKISG